MDTDFVEMAQILDDPPTSEVLQLATAMRDWLREVGDDGEVDSGIGMSVADLWVKFEGKDLLITIRESRNQALKSAH